MVYITGDIHGSIGPIYELFEKFHPTADDMLIRKIQEGTV